MDWIALVIVAGFVLIGILAFAVIIRLSLPAIFRKHVAPRFEGSYAPRDDPVELLSGTPGVGPQEHVPTLVVDPATGIYTISFGNGRAFSEGRVTARHGGTWYSNGLLHGESVTSLTLTGHEVGARDTRLGKAKVESFAWSVGSGGVSFETTFITYAGANYMMFEIRFNGLVQDLQTGRFENPPVRFPSFTNESPNRRVLTFKTQVFSPATRDFTFVTAPVMLFDDDRNACVLSALDHFVTHGVHKDTGGPGSPRISCGPNGLLEALPAGFTQSYLLVFGQGINATFKQWGDILRVYHGSASKDRYMDVITSKIGYFTDNGSYYYYYPVKGKFDATFLAIKEHADKEIIPFRYYQLDSWWYPKSLKSSAKRALVNKLRLRLGGSIYGGAMTWEPDPYYFDMSIGELSRRLDGLPFVAHHRWHDQASPYKDTYKFVVEGGWSYPVDPAYWDNIMDFAKANNIAVYEQDWMISHFNHFKAFKADINAASDWLSQMASAASKRGITIQYCMGIPAMWMEAVKHPNVSNVRGSNDYHSWMPHVFDVPYFTQSSILARALNLWPFKDVFFTTRRGWFLGERCPELEMLLSVLSAGPVAPGDPIGFIDKRLIRAACAVDGTLLKPDRPLTAADIMFTKHDKYYICTTESIHDGLAWHYVLVVNLWPNRVKDEGYTLRELGITGKHVEYDFASKQALVVNDGARIELHLKHEQHAFRVYAPVSSDGWALIGDTDRFATMNDKTFSRVQATADGLEVDLHGVGGEQVNLAVFCPRTPKAITANEIALSIEEFARNQDGCLMVLPVIIGETGHVHFSIQ